MGGTPITTPATRLPDLAGVTVDGRPARAPEPPRLFLFHKPPGVLTTARDPAGRPTLADVLPADLPRLMPVGRLDMTTEGLLLLTNDGALKRRLELPANGFLRTYRVRALGRVSPADLERLAEGIEIDGVRYGPVEASLDRRARAGAANVWLTFRLAEGKNREIRRLCAALGLVVNRLIRVGFGPFALGDLPPRGIVEVPAAEVRRLLAHRP
ncbi:pseudouridine synthase [Thermaurantiacus sp.]|uniref:pseudouridine synthase n=1 Tax=Thermaurantiacus sp. TaxID=2820283 RepID=UPI0039A2213B